MLLNWFPAWQSLRFRVMLIQQCPLQLLHVREDSPSAASVNNLVVLMALSKCVVLSPKAKKQKLSKLGACLQSLSFCISSHVGVFWMAGWEINLMCSFIKRERCWWVVLISPDKNKNYGQFAKEANAHQALAWLTSWCLCSSLNITETEVLSSSLSQMPQALVPLSLAFLGKLLSWLNCWLFHCAFYLFPVENWERCFVWFYAQGLRESIWKSFMGSSLLLSSFFFSSCWVLELVLFRDKASGSSDDT